MLPIPFDRLPSITYLGHATVLVDLNGTRVLTDPLLFDRITFLRRQVSSLAAHEHADIDLVLISHLHHDHTDLRSLRALGELTRLIVPLGSLDFFHRAGMRNVAEMAPGDTMHHGHVRIRCTPADHDGLRVPRGPRAAAVGYVIEADYPTGQTASVYFAGDTDIFPEMHGLVPDLDVALIPVWGWGPNLGPGHLTPQRAAEAVAMLAPRFVVPIHWGTYFPFGLGTIAPGTRRTQVEPPQAFEAALLALGVQTQLLHTPPGHPVRFDP